MLLCLAAGLSCQLTACAQLRHDTLSQASSSPSIAREETDGPIQQVQYEEETTAVPASAPFAGPFTLAAFEQLAIENHPAINQSIAVVNKARGIYDQVGAKPNPIVGYQGVEIGNEGDAGQQGVFFSQTYIRGDKLGWNREVASHDVQAFSWEWKVRIARVRTDVRVQFYETLAAQKRVALAGGLLKIAEDGVKVTRELLEKAEIGSKPDVIQAEIQRDQVGAKLAAAKIAFEFAWKKLAALVGHPDLPQADLEGNLFEPSMPDDFDETFQQLVQSSPEIQAAMARVSRARAEIQRQCVQTTPNILTQIGVAHDTSTGNAIANFQIGIPLTVVNRNQGNISIAQSELHRATHDLSRLQMSLRVRLTEVFGRRQSSHKQAELFRTTVLPKALRNRALIEEGYKKQQFDFLRMLTARRQYAAVNFEYIDFLVEMRKADALIGGMLLSGSLDDVPDTSGRNTGVGLRGQALSGQ